MKARGFTLLEVLLVVAILSGLAGLSIPLYVQYADRNSLQLTTENVAHMLRRAELYARGVNQDTTWGVRVQNGQATLFSGTSYAARNSTLDETLAISSKIEVSGLNEAVFAKVSAAPSTTGTIVLEGSGNNNQKQVSINAKGMVSY